MNKAIFIIEGNIPENMEHSLSKEIETVCQNYGLSSYLDDVIEDDIQEVTKCKRCGGSDIDYLARVHINTGKVVDDFDLDAPKCAECGMIEVWELDETNEGICEHNNTITSECSDCNENELEDYNVNAN